MENIIIERLNTLRTLMEKNNLDAYIIPTNDFHGSEYVGDYFKTRSFISGFTGSAGTLLITKDSSYLWTDGRYFLQASIQLLKSNTKLMKIGEDTPLIDFINNNLSKSFNIDDIANYLKIGKIIKTRTKEAEPLPASPAVRKFTVSYRQQIR